MATSSVRILPGLGGMVRAGQPPIGQMAMDFVEESSPALGRDELAHGVGNVAPHI